MTKIILTGCQTYIRGNKMYRKDEGTYTVTDEQAKGLLALVSDDGRNVPFFTLVDTVTADASGTKEDEGKKESLEADIKEEDIPAKTEEKKDVPAKAPSKKSANPPLTVK